MLLRKILSVMLENENPIFNPNSSSCRASIVGVLKKLRQDMPRALYLLEKLVPRPCKFRISLKLIPSLGGAVLDRPAQRMGASGKHLSMSFAYNGRSIRAVAFGQGDHAPQLPAGAAVDLLFEPKVNTWQGVRRPELHITDFKVLSAVAS